MSRPVRYETLYGARVVRCFSDRPETVDAIFRRSVETYADRPAVALGDRTESYAQLDRTVRRVAAGFSAAGLNRGDRVALLLGNQFEFVYCFLAAARLGLIAVPLNTRQRRPEVSFALNQCAASAIVFDAEFADAVPAGDEIPSVRHVYEVGDGGDGFARLLGDAGDAAVWPQPAGEDPLCLLYTSGTTGQPKGAKLTNVSVVHSVLHYADAFALREGDTSVLAVPISHVTGIVAILLATLYVGGCMVIMPAFKARPFLELAARSRMSFTLMVPAMYNLALLDPDFSSHDLSAWRVAGFGGAPMPEATIGRFAVALPGLALCNVYGSTETSSPATLLPIGDIRRKPGSVGRVLPCADIVVVDEDGRQVPPGQPGELLIGGPMVVPGYWDNPEGDRAGFVGGYWRSGDIGSIDEEGYVYVFDRKKDMINRAGFKVYSVEVESVLAAIPGVIEAAIVGVPDPVLGEKVHAFATVGEEAPTAAEVRRFCGERLSDYKVPDRVTLLSTPLPRNANGKVLKHALREMALETLETQA